MRDQIKLPKEHSTRNYVQMYINLDGEYMHFLALGKNSIEGYNKILDDVIAPVIGCFKFIPYSSKFFPEPFIDAFGLFTHRFTKLLFREINSW